mmetsp:Transcript_76/g.153  ORF Transcript_76/g.153 Transcript_76/m.153 type:complete len:197 (-) Transcript_76:199-789(-)
MHRILPLVSMAVLPPDVSPFGQFTSARREGARNRNANVLSSVSGLTEDGDFAIFGVNAQECDLDDQSSSSQGESPSVNTGAAIGWEGVGGMLFNEELLRSGRVDLGVGSSNRYRDFRGNEVVAKADPAVTTWLRKVLPALNEDDAKAYSEGLTSIGFSPQCASLCEIQYDDLDFMKTLHRRYLFKEITGEEHPFEA